MIHFKTNYNSKPFFTKVVYSLVDEYFETLPKVEQLDYFCRINQFFIVAIGKIATRICGFSPLNSWIIRRYSPPAAKQGILLFDCDYDQHFFHKAYPGFRPVYCNPNNGWICVGNPQASGEAVEFIYDCIAVLGQDHTIQALWIRLDGLPPFTLAPLHKNLFHQPTPFVRRQPDENFTKILFRWRRELSLMEYYE